MNIPETISETHSDDLRLEDLAYHTAVLEQIELEFKNTVAKYDLAQSDADMKYIQGYRKALDWIQKLPQLIIDKQKADKAEAKRKEVGGGRAL